MPQTATATAFGGRAGAMLTRTASVAAIVTGLVFLAVVVIVAALAPYAPHELIPALVLHFLASFFVAHFALEGYSDEWARSGRPIPPGKVTVVAIRYMLLSLALLAPLALAAPWRAAGLEVMAAPTTMAVLVLVYVLIVAIAPPALLVVSVSAASWGELFSARHWVSRFGGRGGDFFLIYVIFVGALFCVMFAGLPLVALAGTSSPKAMMLAGGAVAVFATGFAISLLGRLCGSFAVVAPAPVEEKRPPPVLHPSLAHLAGPAAPQAARPASGTPTPVPPATSRKSVLLDAPARVEELRARHAGDAAALASALRELDEAYLPNPAVRHALVISLVDSGRLQDAVTAAREAIPLCLQSGNVGAAALMCEALLDTGDHLGLAKEQLVSIGDMLRKMKHGTAAVDVYARVLRMDPHDIKAFKGTVAIAQELSHEKETAAVAVRVYDALVTSCPDSALLDFVRDERAKAARKADETR